MARNTKELYGNVGIHSIIFNNIRTTLTGYKVATATKHFGL